MIPTSSWWISLLVLSLGQTDAGLAPDSANADAARMKALQRYYLIEAAQYDFRLDAPQERKLALQTRPLMHWGMFDGWSGAIYIWTHDGRPELIGCIGSGLEGDNRRSVFHEFHCLSEQPLAPVEINGARHWKWSPKTDGFELREFSDTPLPQASPVLRRSQMRSLAQRFRASVGKDRQPLRLMPRPLYQFGGEEDSRHEGAIFAFALAEGTDPELLLMIERRQVGGAQKWFFGPARFTNRELCLEVGEEVVWQVERYGEQWQTNEPKQPYLTVWVKWVTMNEIEAAGKTAGKEDDE